MYLEALTPEMRLFVPRLRSFSGFYLAGGTALALQIGHRLSVDFDFFSFEALPENLFDRVSNTFADQPVKTLANAAQELTLMVGETKMTFLYYPFKTLRPLVDFDGVSLLSIPEIAAAKAWTLWRRAVLRDYVDLYFIFSERYCTIRDVIDIATQKYGNRFNGRLFLEQLVYHFDIKEQPIKYLKKPISGEELMAFFESAVGELKL